MDLYGKMFEFVKNELSSYDLHGGESKIKINYDRFKHTKRVFYWMNRLVNENNVKELIDFEALCIATIFHDSGYGRDFSEKHPQYGADICRKYLNDIGYNHSKIDFICEIIEKHSHKELLLTEDIPLELTLLMEADLLDDTGAQGLVMDAWMETKNEKVSFSSIGEHMHKFTEREMMNNPMKTQAAKDIWEKKSNLVNEFLRQYDEDLQGEKL